MATGGRGSVPGGVRSAPRRASGWLGQSMLPRRAPPPGDPRPLRSLLLRAASPPERPASPPPAAGPRPRPRPGHIPRAGPRAAPGGWRWLLRRGGGVGLVGLGLGLGAGSSGDLPTLGRATRGGRVAGGQASGGRASAPGPATADPAWVPGARPRQLPPLPPCGACTATRSGRSPCWSWSLTAGKVRAGLHWAGAGRQPSCHACPSVSGEEAQGAVCTS